MISWRNDIKHHNINQQISVFFTETDWRELLSSCWKMQESLSALLVIIVLCQAEAGVVLLTTSANSITWIYKDLM